MPPSQSRLASSSPFPIHPKGLNPSLAAPALRPPVRPLLRRTPAPVQGPAAASASRPGLHGHLRPVGCAPPTRVRRRPAPGRRRLPVTTGGSAAGRRPPVRQRVLLRSRGSQIPPRHPQLLYCWCASPSLLHMPYDMR
ncbi:hypothetical protein PAHAL_1G353900 [Panicum hallii]|uniref:Uncharacterized protein n=1 Tax=Panicum hallii TaxID=206008 RepID=A0A2T8KXA5_9POAL|nr:hypothetical protein PAHAL_1G353900 [Panicum hallii]